MQRTDIRLVTSSLRHLKAVRCIADHGSVSAAARGLNRTQSALSKALAELEARIGATLFDRSARGMALTASGCAFVERIREAEHQFSLAEDAYRALGRGGRRQRNPVFDLDVSGRRLMSFLALHETRDVSAAAAHLGHTRAAVYDSIRHLEQLLNVTLFEHGGSRLVPSAFADELASHLKLAFSLIRHGLEEVASAGGPMRGSVVIGTLPYSRTLLTPRTIHRVLEAHPALHISTREGPYAVLEASLRNGDLDLIIGATREMDGASGLVTESLFEDELAVIARAHHPLAGAGRLTLKRLLGYGWVLPVRGTPARQLFDECLATHRCPEPAQVIETSSMALIRGLLLESDRLALLSRHQVHYEEKAGMLTVMPIRLAGTYRPIGITRRGHTTPSPAAQVFIQTLREMAALRPREPGPSGARIRTERSGA